MGLGLGFSFGSKKSSGSGTDTTNQTVALTGSQNQNTNESGATTSATSGTTSSTGQQSGVTTQDQSQAQSGTTKSSGTTTTLGGDVMSSLSAAVKQVLSGGINPANIDALSSMIAGRTGFDSQKFVAGQVDAARTRGEQTLQEATSARNADIGGTPATNSMAELLAARGRNDLESSIAGVQANATATAEDIQNKNLTAATGAQSGIAGIGAALTEALKGGTTTTDTTQLMDQIQQLVGKGTTAESTASQQATESNTATTQLLNTIAQILTNQTQQTTGTETQTQKGKSGGLGLSLGI